MIEPEDDELQQDDQLSQTDEQASQQDIHSNGFDDTVEEIGEVDETTNAQQAYDAAESSYTLDFGDDTDPDED